jgi:hypothetical protein
MAKGIQDIGVGFGYLYMTDVTGTQILATQPNTVSGVRNMRQQGTSTAPIVASRPAVGELRVLSVASIGSITNIDIYGINQIGANIAVTSSTTSVVAGQIAAAINAYTASPVNFTAQAINNIVYLFSPANAQPGYPNYNGASITVSVTDPSIQTSTTPTTNGSTQFSNSYDDVFGFRFLLDADYGPAGVPGSQPATPTSTAYAIEITEYFTVRGMQSGIVTINSTIATDRLLNLNRTCAFTQIIVDTQASAATDVLAFIQTIGFVEGDEIRLRNTNPSRVPVLEDATVSTSPIATKNIYLIDQAPFSITGYLSINLQLRNDPSLGFIWVETGRSISDGVITTTRSQIASDANLGLIKPKGLYHITDIGDEGVYVFGLSPSEIETTGTLLRYVPKNYSDTWRTDMSLPTVGDKVRYYQNVYTSVTGAVGSTPDTDTTNWAVVSKLIKNNYELQSHTVGINNVGLLGTWPILWERDTHNNFISQSFYAFTALSRNAFEIFLWKETNATDCSSNTVIDGIFDCANSMGSVIGNIILSGAKYENNFMPPGSFVLENYLANSNTSVYDNYITVFAYNRITEAGLIHTNGAAGAYFYQIGGNEVQGAIHNCTISSAGLQEITGFNIATGCVFRNSTFGGSSIVRFCTIGGQSTLENCVFSAPLGVFNMEGSEITGNSTVTLNDTGGRILYNSKIHNSTVTINANTYDLNSVCITNSSFTFTANANSLNSTIENSTLNFTGSLSVATIIAIATTGTPTIGFSGYISPTSTNGTATLDLDLPSVFSAGVLTIDPNLQFTSQILLTTTIPRNITEVVGLPLYEVEFINITSNAITFTTTSASTITGNEIAGTAASFTITSYPTFAVDRLYMNNIFSINTITRTTILI